ncbi:hypothetical protein [Micromonospora sp. NPDC093277]|uniref:hypothetical protein n=1 Tax=Micromonospora sp. NPDC093277 TaxID=3364291 RepID=UPI00380621D6
MGRQVERVSVWPAVLVVVLLVCGAGALAGWQMMWWQFRKNTEARALAEAAELDRRLRLYADAVIADGEIVPSDEHLVALGQSMGVAVREIHRVPSLTVVVYRVWYGSSANRCDQITFLDLGRPSAAARIETLPACPAATGLPNPASTAPARPTVPAIRNLVRLPLGGGWSRKGLPRSGGLPD